MHFREHAFLDSQNAVFTAPIALKGTWQPRWAIRKASETGVSPRVNGFQGRYSSLFFAHDPLYRRVANHLDVSFTLRSSSMLGLARLELLGPDTRHRSVADWILTVNPSCENDTE